MNASKHNMCSYLKYQCFYPNAFIPNTFIFSVNTTGVIEYSMILTVTSKDMQTDLLQTSLQFYSICNMLAVEIKRIYYKYRKY